MKRSVSGASPKRSKLRDYAGIVHVQGTPGTFGAFFTKCERNERGGDVRYGTDQLEEVDDDAFITCFACLAKVSALS